MESPQPLSDRTAIEALLRSYADAGQYHEAAKLAIDRYGAEVLGYIVTILSVRSDADEAFSEVCERLWRGLPSFEWRCSCRTWMYVIARNVVQTRVQAIARANACVVPLSRAAEVSKLAERVRSSTALHLKTESRTRLDQVRAALEPDDRTLLVLRIDRKLSWAEIAEILSGEGACAGPARVRQVARLRKRFERLRSRVIKLVRQELSTPIPGE